jgi:hypothetical protein
MSYLALPRGHSLLPEKFELGPAPQASLVSAMTVSSELFVEGGKIRWLFCLERLLMKGARWRVEVGYRRLGMLSSNLLLLVSRNDRLVRSVR